jgi:hypothetical protein
MNHVVAIQVDSLVVNGLLVALTGLLTATAAWVRSLTNKVAAVQQDTQRVVDKLPPNGGKIASTADVNGIPVDEDRGDTT